MPTKPEGSKASSWPRFPEIATALNDLTIQQLASTIRNEEQQQQLAFLLKALGRMDAVEQIRPALKAASAMRRRRPRVRKHGLQAVAMIAGRRQAKGETLADSELVDAVIRRQSRPIRFCVSTGHSPWG